MLFGTWKFHKCFLQIRGENLVLKNINLYRKLINTRKLRIIEDKIFPKRNSLDSSANQELENPEIFANKIKSGIDKKSNSDFLIVARIESLIAGTGLKDAIKRAEHYIDAGIDGIMIHSNEKNPKDLIDFAKKYNSICNKFGKRPLLVSVPTTYNNYTEKSLIDLGFNIIIHANHLLRASHQAMKETAQIILNDGKSERVDKHITPVKENNTPKI